MTNQMLQPSWNEGMSLLRELPTLPLEERAEVIERLMRNPSPGIRERALRVGVAVLREETLVQYLRSDSDAVLRNAALEILKDREGRSFDIAVGLLDDEDNDVAMQAVLILDHIKDPRAVEPLRAALHHPDLNVVQATIVALGHLGNGRIISDLLPFLAAKPWLQLAAVQALGDLRSPLAIDSLKPYLTDLMVGPLAAESIAHIGGPEAFETLAHHWLDFHEKLDPEIALGLLAHVLEGLTENPEQVDGLRSNLATRLRDPFGGVRSSAARCLLALGSGGEDGEALNVLGSAQRDADLLPSCLARRQDLIAYLLAKDGALRSWGFFLAARFPGSVTAETFAEALRDWPQTLALGPVVRALSEAGELDIGQAIIDFYLERRIEDRVALGPILRRRRSELRGAAASRRDISIEDRLVLAASLGEPAAEIIAGILELSPSTQRRVVSQLTDDVEVMRGLPWQDWLREDPERYADLACGATMDSGLRDLLAPLRQLLSTQPQPDIVRALGETRDRESVPLLLQLLAGKGKSPVLDLLIIESLGKIGGPEARKALRDLAASEDQKTARVSYKALAACAAEEDDEFFRAAATHSDWYVRLAAAEVLGRYVRPENLDALSQLAADPVSVVARRGLAAIREEGSAA